jgi:ABC-2 type transport system permease protein
MLRNIAVIAWRELVAYFTSPLAYVFIIVFLMLLGGLTFYFGNFVDRGQADLLVFFQFHPWLYLLLMPAIGMRLWAEERKTGTLELLMTLPITTGEAVVGKFLAAWIFAGIALDLTVPIWITVNYLGNPDNGVIMVSYLASWMVAGCFLALSACASALTSNQVIAFVLAAATCFLFLVSGLEIVQAFFKGWAPPLVTQTIANMSVLTNFHTVAEGLVDVRQAIFFVSLIVVALFVNTAIVEIKKAA